MGWKFIEIDEASNLKLYLNNLLIFKNNLKYSIHLSDVDVLMFNNYKTNISVQLLMKLSEFNILLIVCDSRHLPVGQYLPFSGNYNSLKILNWQMGWSKKDKGVLWQKIIENKISNQIKLLDYLKLDSSLLKEFKTNVKFFDITNREGHASKVYWHQLFGKEFNRRDEDNPINSLLNYAYAILLSYFSRSIVKKGLDTKISIFHKSFNNHFALSSDLMEPFRFLIDLEVYKITKENSHILLSEFKERIINIFNKKIIINNKKEYINNAIDEYIDKIIKKWEISELNLIYDQC